ncbi:MAG: fibronectin type III domain-containing protein [Burkholderiales bacterium]|nr:fibronectin type III domain-containing protein [Opitutaceae bacterium]
MKPHCLRLFTSLAALGILASTPVSATLLTYEGFDYTASANLTGQTGGSGWRSPSNPSWASGGTTGTIAATGLSYTAISAAYTGLTPTGLAANLSGALQNNRLPAIDTGGVYATAALRGSGNFIGGSTVTGTLWGSFLVSANLWSTGSGPQILFNLDSNTGTGTRVSIRQIGAGSAINLTNTGGGGIGAAGTIPADSLSTTTPNLIVFRIVFNGAGNDTVDVWLNPTSETNTPAITASVADVVFNNILIRSVNANGGLAFDEIRFGTTPGDVMPQVGVDAPAAPSGLGAVANAYNSVGLTWTDNSNNELNFLLERSLNGTTGWTQIAQPAADATSYTDTTTNALTTYHYRLRASNSGGDSAYTTVVNVTTPAAEVATPPPTNMAGTPNSFSEITLTWTDNTTDETAFVLQRSPDGTTEWSTIATLAANTTSYQDISLTAATTYHYRTYAVAPSGDSVPSGTASVTTSALPAEVALEPISLSFSDEDGLNANLLLPVPGITAYAGQGFVRSTSALTYPGLTTTGNGYESVSGQSFYFTLDTTLPGLARYVSGGQIGGSGLGVLYVRWLASGVNANEGNTVGFSTAANDTGANGRASVGTTFSNAFIRAMAASTATSGINTYVNSPLTPSVGTDLYVARFTFSPTGVTNMAVFVNQTTEGTPDATVTGAIRFNTISISKFGPAAVPSFDEFRIAKTFAEAVALSSTPMQTWYGSFGLPTDGTGTGAFDADPDADGVVNLLEYALDSDPTLADGGNLPTISTVVDGGQNYLAITFVRLTNPASGITYTPESSADLADWSGVPVQVGTAVNNNDGTETVVYRDSLPTAGNPKRFIRVRVTAAAN